MHKPYVLVTAARNEIDFLERTITSVIGQSVKPAEWIIVSDRSTDGTDALVKGYADRFPFIRLLRNDEPLARSTSAKVKCINIGLRELRTTDHAYIGNLDADVSFGGDYFFSLMKVLESEETLGIVGGRIVQAASGKEGEFEETHFNPESVPGAVQFFRRECFERIGGYLPISGGMEDGIAEISARYYGWRTRAIQDLPVVHHRELGTVGRSVFRARFNSGLTEYAVGYTYTYHLVRAMSRVLERPHVIGSLLVASGYLWGLTSRRARVVPAPIMQFLRDEQMARLRSRFVSRFSAGHRAPMNE